MAIKSRKRSAITAKLEHEKLISLQAAMKVYKLWNTHVTRLLERPTDSVTQPYPFAIRRRMKAERVTKRKARLVTKRQADALKRGRAILARKRKALKS